MHETGKGTYLKHIFIDERHSDYRNLTKNYDKAENVTGLEQKFSCMFFKIKTSDSQNIYTFYGKARKRKQLNISQIDHKIFKNFI